MSCTAKLTKARARTTCRQHGGSTHALPDIEQIVQHFITEYRERSARELRFYRIQPSLEQAITVAALAQLPSGKRHPHQRRIPRVVLEEMRDCLLVANLEAYNNFHDLITAVEEHVSTIRGVGDLTIYDTAHRIGAYLGVEPDVVYLHAGARVGARAIGITNGQKMVRIEDLPYPFRRLTASEIEDCLCLYRDELRQASNS